MTASILFRENCMFSNERLHNFKGGFRYDTISNLINHINLIDRNCGDRHQYCRQRRCRDIWRCDRMCGVYSIDY